MTRTCECGNVLNDSRVPNTFVFWMYSYPEEWEINKKRYIDIAYKKELFIGKQVWHCKKCERILTIFKIDGEARTFYLSDKKEESEQTNFCSKCGKEKEILIAVNDFQYADTGRIVRSEGVETENFKGCTVSYCSDCHIAWVKTPESDKILKYEMEK